MKQLALSILLIGLFSACSGGKYTQQSNLQEQGISGNVESMTITTAKAIKQGKQWVLGELPPNQAIEVISYNENGYKSSHLLLGSDKQQQRLYKHSYNEEGLLSETLQYYSEDTPTYKMVYQYDSAKFPFPTARITTDLVDNFTANTLMYKYGKKGVLLEKKEVNSADQANYIDTYEYKKGVKIYSSRYLASEQTYRAQQYQYNEEGQVSEITYLYGENPLQIRQFTYNEKGDLIETKTLSPDDRQLLNTRTYEYQYDSLGNWTQQVIIEDGKGFYMVQREITYY